MAQVVGGWVGAAPLECTREGVAVDSGARLSEVGEGRWVPYTCC